MLSVQEMSVKVYLPDVAAKDWRGLVTSGYRDRSLALKLSDRIRRLAGDREYLIMHVCGT